MKAKTLLLIGIVMGLLTSCATEKIFYQVYKTNSEGMRKNDKSVFYEDDTCKIIYNLWGDGGNFRFEFYNKTDQNIYVNLEESFFIMNGMANNYYKNRAFTYSSESATSRLTGTAISPSITFYSSGERISSKSSSVTYNEEKIIIIPPKTSKILGEYAINTTVYRDCDLVLYPSKKQDEVKSFTKQESPYVFSNKIAYRVGKSGASDIVENNFYVSEISNLSENKEIRNDYETFCGQASIEKKSFFLDVAPDKFYIEYKKTKESFWKH